MEFPRAIFKAYDIRGKYPDEISGKLIKAVVAALMPQLKPKRVVVAHDARISSPALYREVVKNLAGKKARIVKAGMATTPELYFLVNYYKADMGIMITASHNPAEYNGLKIVGREARPLSGEDIYKMLLK